MTAAGSGELGEIVVYGAGGHGQVVAEAARLGGIRLLAFIDDTSVEAEVAGLRVLPPNDGSIGDARFALGIGDNAARRRLGSQQLSGRRLVTVIHPRAFVSPSADVGAGVFVGANAVVHTASRIGEGAIVNTAAIVEHHCVIGAYAHVAPGAVMGGGVFIGERTLVGLGARILPRVTIGKDAVIGAGAIVLRDVPDGARVVGVHH